MISLEKRLFWIDKGYTVLLEGKAGTGKTSITLEAFEKAGLKYAYFSGSTLDPFIDFCGVPVKVDGPDGSIIKLILPEHMKPNEIEAIFIDEYNRCLTGDTLIQLANGYSVPIKDLVDKDYFYVYSYDLKNKKLAIGKAHSARLTHKKAETVKVTLDNGLVVRCTPDHPFLLTNGLYIRADCLAEGDSLMALYKKYNFNGYELVSSFRPTRWTLTYHLADEFNIRHGLYKAESDEHRHHKDYNRSNNSPENIERLTRGAHIIKHAAEGGRQAHFLHPDLLMKTIGNEEAKKKALIASGKTRKTEAHKQLRSQVSKSYWDDEHKSKQSERAKQGWANGQFDNFDRSKAVQKTHISYTVQQLQSHLGDDVLTPQRYDLVYQRLRRNGKGRGILLFPTIEKYFGTFDNFIDYYHKQPLPLSKNHRVISIEPGEKEDVYDITVDEFNNFAIGQGIFVHNSHKKVRNALLELIQFKTINGRPFGKLRVIWAAINPAPKDDDDIENAYDVERLDRAQRDRFIIQVPLPYECNEDYFVKKYNDSLAKSAIQWWDDLPEKIKDDVSPRRLDYAIQVFCDDGDIVDVLPRESNPSRLKSLLGTGPAELKLQKMMDEKDEEGARFFFKDPNNYDYAIPVVLDNTKFLKFFLPVLENEKISSLLSDKWSKVRPIIFSDLKQKKEKSCFYQTLKEISKANQNNRLSKRIDAEFKKIDGLVVKKDADGEEVKKIDFWYNADAPDNYEENLTGIALVGTSATEVHRLLSRNSAARMNKTAAWTALKIMNTRASALKKMDNFVELSNHLIIQLLSNGAQPNNIEKSIGVANFAGRETLLEIRKSLNAPSIAEIQRFVDSSFASESDELAQW